MNITFLCGSLEQGRDGVGDYSRQLAAALTEHGHCVSLLALFDSYLTEPVASTQAVGEVALKTLRLPATWPAPARLQQAQAWLAETNPEWISLQFVPFSFHEKGLPFNLGKQLLPLGMGRKWHIMFHELWVGMDQQASVKYRVWGWMQKQIIKSLVQQLRPSVIHTQTKLYQHQLQRLGVRAHYLPLFSNISKYVASPALPAQKEGGKDLTFLVFGTIHADTPIAAFAEEVSQYAKRHAVEAKLVLVGRCGREQEHWTKVWEAAGMAVQVLGEQPTERISQALQTASVGLSTNPVALVEKSGTAAAMREHGLPVVCLSRAWHPRPSFSNELISGISEYRTGQLEAILLKAVKSPSKTNVKTVSQQMLESFSVPA